MTALIFKLKHANAIVRATLSLAAALVLASSIVVAQQKDQDNVETWSRCNKEIRVANSCSRVLLNSGDGHDI